ncbi:MAG: YtxH domain-containing protein [Clostridiales bacterium]|jgi:hypothetical protein|nr:YtxH domain-containing protein [Clostridiales bacterium]
MRKFTSGLLAGSLIGAAGIALVMSGHRTRKHMARGGKRAMHKANAVLENMQDMF